MVAVREGVHLHAVEPIVFPLLFCFTSARAFGEESNLRLFFGMEHFDGEQFWSDLLIRFGVGNVSVLEWFT